MNRRQNISNPILWKKKRERERALSTFPSPGSFPEVFSEALNSPRELAWRCVLAPRSGRSPPPRSARSARSPGPRSRSLSSPGSGWSYDCRGKRAGVAADLWPGQPQGWEEKRLEAEVRGQGWWHLLVVRDGAVARHWHGLGLPGHGHGLAEVQQLPAEGLRGGGGAELGDDRDNVIISVSKPRAHVAAAGMPRLQQSGFRRVIGE